jgi:predicted GH43/DUF377 family glycosyl hydrolase
MLRALLAACLALCGCGRYADFTLPAPDASGPKPPFVSQPLRGAPVLGRGAAGEWDSSDVLNPSAVRFHGALWNFYSGFDGRTWRTGAAIEESGTWRKLGMVLSPEGWEGNYIAANGSALAIGDEILYWYEAGEPKRIALARSRDGRSWSKLGRAVVETGPNGSFDERAVADPYVIRAGDRYFMFYLGQDRARRQRLGVARSSDGIAWEKLRSNPVLDLGGPGSFDEVGLGEPAVWTSGGTWWMLYTGRDRLERRRIGLARSSDGARWERVPNFPPIAGGERWNREVVCDPHVETAPEGTLRLWYGGGDMPRPDEGLNGAIGFAVLAR